MSTVTSQSGITISEPASRSPSASSTSSSRRPRANSAQLQEQVEAERAEVLSDVKETHAGEFIKVDALSQQLESATSDVLDMFKRDLPDVVGTRQSTDEAALRAGQVSSGGVVITSPTPTSATINRTAALVHDRASLVQSSEQPPVTEAPSSISSVSVNIPASSPHVVESAAASSEPSALTEKEQQIQQLSLALIQTKQAYAELLGRLYSSDVGSSLLGADARTLTSSPSALLSTVDSDDRSLLSFLHDLPVLRGYLMMRSSSSSSGAPAAYTRKYCSLAFNALLIADDEKGTNAQKVDIARYWLIERTGDRMSSDTNYAKSSASSPAEAASPRSPVAGKSVFHMEDGAFVIRLVPILVDAAHPHNVLEPDSSDVLELTGASDSSVSSPDELSVWVDALNLRISLLSLLSSPDHHNLLARGGREVLTFLCSLSSHSLVIEHKLVDVSTLLSYFKEALLHRHDFSIVLRNVAMDDAGARALSELLMLNQNIQHVDLSHNLITDAGAAYLASSLEVNHNITSLILDANSCTSEGIMEIINALAQSSRITHLSLAHLSMNDDTLQTLVDVLCDGARHPWTLLNFSHNKLTDAISTSIARLFNHFIIHSLNLSHNCISDSILSIIHTNCQETAKSRISLQWMDLSYNKLTSTGIMGLNSFCLKSFPNVSMKLSGNEMTGSALTQVLTANDWIIEELRIKRRGAEGAKGGDEKPEFGRKLSITKEHVSGRVELIDPLHPTSEKQLGRAVEELSMDKEDRQHGHAEEEKEALDAPVTAASTDLLVAGGKTADPRA